jgi:antitoxin MazE
MSESMKMRTKVVRIGNSRGIRIPKPLIQQTGLGEEIEITVRENTLVISPARAPRSGWAGAFQAMAEHGDDTRLDRDSVATSRWDDDEWDW